jgi:hypothetical protein
MVTQPLNKTSPIILHPAKTDPKKRNPKRKINYFNV